MSATREFAPGTNESCMNVLISDDPILEGEELFTLTLVSTGDQSIAFGPVSNVTVSIIDNDGR